MSAFDNATAFFHACESLKGWEGCQQYVAPGAGFAAQSEPLSDVTTVEAYCEWMAGFGLNVAPGCSYELHASSFDDSTRTALFFATFTGKHTGEGGPVPPTGQETRSHYVYALTMDESDRVANMVKIWNAPWAMRELGWA
jgi:hypothetical protein